MDSSLKKEFKAFFPELVGMLTDHYIQKGLPTDFAERINYCLTTTLQNSRLHHGLAAVYASRVLVGNSINEEQKKETLLLGWMVELFQNAVLIWDDIMDNSHTRRGQPCWFRRPEVGMMAVNDAALQNSFISLILKKSFHGHRSYANMVDLFAKTGFTLQTGQLWEAVVGPQGEENMNLDRFSMEVYLSILFYKACYYGAYLPVALAMEYAELATNKNKAQSIALATAIGQYFQVQNDFLDVFGDPILTGKDGTDIQENKCAWVVCAALPRCTAEQREVLKDSYGKWDETHVERVKAVFKELGMEKVYQDYEEEQAKKIKQMIAAVDESEGLNSAVFTGIFSGAKKGREYHGIVRKMEADHAF
ncbi:hypothetical protein NHJ13734_009535 [Beauveria thailandica]